MEHVYKQHFGLVRPPFNITPDPSFLYPSASHREGLAQLLYGVNARRGFIVLTGEVGTGKTTLIQSLLHQLSEETHTALIFNAITSPLDLLRYVCEEFELVPALKEAKDEHHYICLLNEFLLEKYRVRENAALIIDEAQNLSWEVLESIRLLSNFETTKDKLLQILLVGQPELTERLNSPQLRQLKQRVTLRHHLRPFSLGECHEYIANRLKQAGGNAEIFPPNTVEVIQQYSGGIPRLINVICDNAMINAYALDKKEVEPAFVYEVADDLCLSGSVNRLSANRRDIAIRSERRAGMRGEIVNPPSVQLIRSNRVNSVAESSEGVGSGVVIPEKFLHSLREALIDAMGPMAHIVLSEHVKLLGQSWHRFPREKLGSLVNAVSREIFDESIRKRFCQSMSEEINAL